MMQELLKTIQVVLESLTLPNTGLSLANLKAIKTIETKGQALQLSLKFGLPIEHFKERLEVEIQQAVLLIDPSLTVQIQWQSKIAAHQVVSGTQAIPNVKNIIAISSAKGGVGKSTTTVNLALALSQQGAKVGILDADIYGPNQPHMLGTLRKPEATKQKKFIPVEAHGLQTMSIGYLIDAEAPMVWRGPMVSQALQQLLFDTVWGELDYLLIDLPPGTGDIQLTLAKKVPVSGAIIVTTPQDVALLDARKGVEMFRKVSVPVLGVVENMSTHICSQCGHEEALFGKHGGEKLAQACDVPLLGQLPLKLDIREAVDNGHPTVAADPTGQVAQLYHQIGVKMTAYLARQAVNYAVKFPEIVVEPREHS